MSRLRHAARFGHPIHNLSGSRSILTDSAYACTGCLLAVSGWTVNVTHKVAMEALQLLAHYDSNDMVGGVSCTVSLGSSGVDLELLLPEPGEPKEWTRNAVQAAVPCGSAFIGPTHLLAHRVGLADKAESHVSFVFQVDAKVADRLRQLRVALGRGEAVAMYGMGYTAERHTFVDGHLIKDAVRAGVVKITKHERDVEAAEGVGVGQPAKKKRKKTAKKKSKKPATTGAGVGAVPSAGAGAAASGELVVVKFDDDGQPWIGRALGAKVTVNGADYDRNDDHEVLFLGNYIGGPSDGQPQQSTYSADVTMVPAAADKTVGFEAPFVAHVLHCVPMQYSDLKIAVGVLGALGNGLGMLGASPFAPTFLPRSSIRHDISRSHACVCVQVVGCPP